MNYYKVLGIDKSATKEDIKKAYKNLARKWHPDKNKSPDASQKFKEVSVAYQILYDPVKKKEYDNLMTTNNRNNNRNYNRNNNSAFFLFTSV